MENGKKPKEEVTVSQKRSFFHINKSTLPLKITLFLFYGAMSSILPYLTIQMKDIGISLSQIAIIYAVLPFTSFLGPPIMGFMADKMGQYKTVLIVVTILSGIFNTSLLFVPKYSETIIDAPAEISFGVDNSGGFLHPVSPDLCSEFQMSLASRYYRVRNRVINVHSCNDNGNKSNIGSRGMTSSPLDVPPVCFVDPAEESDTPRVTCGDTPSPESEPYLETPIKRLGRAILSGESEPVCAFKIEINPPRNLTFVTCKTNYTFDSGERITSGNGPLTFWSYFVLRVLGNVFISSCFSLLDATTLSVVGSNEGSEYGKERILCTLGFAVISPLAGLLVDRVSAMKGYTDYSAAFYFSNAMLVINVLSYFFMQLQVEKPGENFWKNATTLLNYPEVVMFLGMIFVLGNMWGFVESYLFIFLDELNAPKYLLGLTLTVGSLSSIPFLYGAEKMVAKAGRVNIIILAFLVYFLRFFGYSYIPNPFWCFPFEAMEAFTYHLMWVAAATYCAVLAPKGLLATLTGVMGSLHYGLGKGSGAFIGGYVINASNTRLAFRYFGAVAGIVGVSYFVINKVWLEGAIKRRNELENRNSNERNEDISTKEQKEAMLSSNDV